MSSMWKLTQKEKELVAVAASIASGCLPCTTHYIKLLREAGATEAEVLKAINIALDVRNNAAEIMAEAARSNTDNEYPIKIQSAAPGVPSSQIKL